MAKRKRQKYHKAQQQTALLNGVRVNRKFKDSLFRMVFRGRKELLSLYNAINRSDYQNPEELEITTIEDAIYIGVKNDVSFLINDVINLYEAQSSDNPNMPLRGLLYFAQLYQGYVAKYQLNIYSSTKQKYTVDCAVNECIEENILKDFLVKHRAEVKNVILTEYDAKQHIEAEKSESYREGEAHGRKEGRKEGKLEGESNFATLSLKLLSEGKTEELKRAAQDDQFRQKLYQEYEMRV